MENDQAPALFEEKRAAKSFDEEIKKK